MQSYDAETLVNDSVALMRTFSAIANPFTGIGNTRDKTTQISVNTNPRRLNRAELAALSEIGVTARSVHLYPEDAGQAWCKIDLGSGDDDPQDILEYWRDLRNGKGGMSVRDAFVLAAALGRQDGDGFVVLGVADGKDSWEPIDRGNIKSVEWVKVMSVYEMRPYQWHTNPLNPEHYRTTDANGKEVLWHRDRVYRFHGVKLLQEGLRRNNGLNLSVIQAMFNSWSRREQSLQSAMLMIINHQLRTLGMKGLSQLLKNDKALGQGEEALLKRLLALDMGTSASRTLLHDMDDETIENLNINYGGVDKIVEKVDDAWIADSDMPRVMLLNTIGTTGLTSGESYQMAMYDWAFRVQGWADIKWKSHLEHLTEITLLAEDSPIGIDDVDGWSITIPLNLKLTPLQQMDLENKAAERSQKLVAMGAIKPIEVRKGYRGTDFNIGIVLDDDDDVEGTGEAEEDDTGELNEQLEALKKDTLYNDSLYNVWFRGRNTPYVVEAATRSEAIAKARRDKPAGWDQLVVSARPLKGKSLKQAQKGQWVRERSTGKETGGSFKYRPQLKEKAKNVLSPSQRGDSLIQVPPNVVKTVKAALALVESTNESVEQPFIDAARILASGFISDVDLETVLKLLPDDKQF
ncbi:MAG: DUF1073 domain-containing protein [Iphinoe sp. HA4291-MV1]|jgi:phage-related protein (TIGR01555 family)|nr:DUF1073 domain-containing protein [Iphinoe sp. HA4291-MV1]